MKTLVVNGKPKAAGRTEALLRYVKRITRREKLVNPSISLKEGIIFELEKAVP